MIRHIILLTAVALVCENESAKTYQQFIEERDVCFNESKLPEENIEMIKQHKFPDNAGCFFRCMGIKADIWEDVIGFNNDKAYGALTAAGYQLDKEDFVKCNSPDKKSDDACKWSADVTKCMWDNKFVKRKL